jgi:cytochrome c
VFRFTQGLEAGVNRVVRGPDGALYVGGIGSTGNWGQEDKLSFGLQRFAYTGAPVFELLAVRARTNGLELELTEPLPAGLGWDPRDYEVRAWRYEPTREYGGPKLDERELPVRSASVSEDRRRVFLELADLCAGHVVHVRLAGPFASEGGRGLWSTEAWYTLNALPLDRPGEVRAAPPVAPPNVLSDAERAAGFELLFDGARLDSWRGWQRAEVPAAWRAADGALAFVPGEDGGDLATREVFGDFELRLEWRVAEGGNSGVFYRACEDHGPPWETGPELQVLDDTLHKDGRDPRTSAGACYALYAPPFRVARAAGGWNEARIRVERGRVRHWQNGHLVVDYELGSADWEARVQSSKFADLPAYGRHAEGRIVLQDHGDPVWFRSLRIVRLPR